MPTCLCYYYRPAKPLFSQFHSQKQQVLPSIHSIEQSRSHNRNDNLPIYSGNLAFNSPNRPERAASESTPSTCSPAHRIATSEECKLLPRYRLRIPAGAPGIYTRFPQTLSLQFWNRRRTNWLSSGTTYTPVRGWNFNQILMSSRTTRHRYCPPHCTARLAVPHNRFHFLVLFYMCLYICWKACASGQAAQDALCGHVPVGTGL